MAWFDKRILTKAECEEIKKNNADIFESDRLPGLMATGKLPYGYYIPVMLIAGQDKADHSVSLYTAASYVLDTQPVTRYEDHHLTNGRYQWIWTLAMSVGEHEELFVTVPELRGLLLDVPADMFDGLYSQVIVPYDDLPNSLRLIEAWKAQREREAAAK